MTEQLESVFELRTKYGEERASMLNRLFTLPSEIADTDEGLRKEGGGGRA
jgi:hypothetical protein